MMTELSTSVRMDVRIKALSSLSYQIGLSGPAEICD